MLKNVPSKGSHATSITDKTNAKCNPVILKDSSGRYINLDSEREKSKEDQGQDSDYEEQFEPMSTEIKKKSTKQSGEAIKKTNTGNLEKVQTDLGQRK